MKESDINIFLDSNVLISDFFWKSSYSRSLLDLKSKSKKINIYISSLVLNEVNNYYERELKGNIDRIKQSLSKFNRDFFSEDLYKIDFQRREIHIKALISFYLDFIEKDIIIKVEENNDLLPILVKKAIKRLPPFFNEVGSKKKQEFRDALIWHTYSEYIKLNNLKNCFFITNNKKDFWDLNKKDLHPSLKKENQDLKVYESIKDFISNEDSIKKIINNSKFNSWLKNQKIDSNYFKTYIDKYFKESLIYEFKKLISDNDLKKYLMDKTLMAFKITEFEEEFKVGGHTLSVIGDYALADIYIHFNSIGEEFKAEYFNSETNRIESKSKKVVVIVNLSLTIKKDEIHKIRDLKIYGVLDPERYPNSLTIFETQRS